MADVSTPAVSTGERFFRFWRPALALWLALVLASGQWIPSGNLQLRTYLVLLALLALSSIIAAFMRPAQFKIGVPGLAVIVLDLCVIAGYTYLFRGFEGAFYPAVIVLPVVYALAVPEREALVVTAAVTAAYTAGYWWSEPAYSSTILFGMSVAAVPVIGTVVAVSAYKQRSHEHQTEIAIAENVAMNQELQRWVSELQAVSQITEVVHSSLDFEAAGSSVLDILAKVIGIHSCSLFVVDKQSSQTIFSATYGMSDEDVTTYFDGGNATLLPSGDHFSCFPVFDHDRTAVVFCASAEEMESLSAEDKLVLRTVASELVVAAENARLYRLSQHLAVTDELTKLPNYRSLQSALDNEIERAKRFDKKVSLLMIDADNFKDFNDSEGHVAGDVALQELAAVIARSVREVDTAARYGGEEFAVVLPETDATGAFVVAEKIRENVELHRFLDAHGQRECGLTVSVGVASYPAHAGDKDLLLRSADDALYRAKNGGKNRVRAPHNGPTLLGESIVQQDA